MTFEHQMLNGEGMVKRSRLAEFFVRANPVAARGFKEWVFNPGMQFRSMDKWWGDFGTRISEHEGLDLCLYEDQEGNSHRMSENMKVPAMYSGRVAAFIDDFLGESVILAHDFFGDQDYRLCTLYAHTQRYPGVDINDEIGEGDIIATVADTHRSKSGISPHLHISAAWMAPGVTYSDLDWSEMGRRSDIILIDPLSLIRAD